MNEKTYEIDAVSRPPTRGRMMRITCLDCGSISYNADDITHRYCGWCHQFHDDKARLPKEQRLPNGRWPGAK